MAIARQTNEEYISPLPGGMVRRFVAGSAISAGELVVMSSDGQIDPADATSAAVTVAGVAIEDGVAGQKIDVVTWGPVTSITGGTPGKTVHASDTAGEPAESAGSNAGIAGWVESATVLFVNPVVNTV